MSPWRCFLVARVACGLLLAVPACKTLTPAPYAKGSAPPAARLLENTGPPLSAIQVPDARIRANRGVRGNLAFLAQAPHRFRASVTVAGNEMVSMALFDGGYDLIYKLDDLPQGYYHGPSSDCAVEVLLGVPLQGDQLVTLVLGGVPVLENHTLVSQAWDERTGRERLRITDGRYDEELRFVVLDGQWRFTGATLWHRNGDERLRLWTLEHEDWHTVEGVALPGTTRLSRPSGSRDQFVRVDYRVQHPAPEFARRFPVTKATQQINESEPESTIDDSQAQPPSPDPWQGGGDWEEGEPGEAPAAGPTSTGQGPGDAGQVSPDETSTLGQSEQTSPGTVVKLDSNVSRSEPSPGDSAESRPAASTVPPLFRLSPGSLPDRGDVCAVVRSRGTAARS